MRVFSIQRFAGSMSPIVIFIFHQTCLNAPHERGAVKLFPSLPGLMTSVGSMASKLSRESPALGHLIPRERSEPRAAASNSETAVPESLGTKMKTVRDTDTISNAWPYRVTDRIRQ